MNLDLISSRPLVQRGPPLNLGSLDTQTSAVQLELLLSQLCRRQNHLQQFATATAALDEPQDLTWALYQVGCSEDIPWTC